MSAVFSDCVNKIFKLYGLFPQLLIYLGTDSEYN